jgi:predicted AlkP superfamily phosphohydrolase/phosphomutase
MTTVVLGLDGGAFELIRDWIDEDRLPNLARISSEGAAMDMQSWLPPVTCPNWRCYASGVNPGKLGVFWWERVNRETNSMEPTSSADQFDGGEYWSLLDGPVSVINFPTGSPPSEVDGEFIAGGPGSDQTGFTYPPELEDDLRERFDYQVHPEQMSPLSKDDQDNDCVAEIHRLIEMRFDVLQDRLESGKFELIHATVFYINVLHHFYWDREVVREAWELIDERVGDLLASDELDCLFVMSDHGSNRIDVEFNINEWLEQNGYLVRRTGASDVLSAVGITRDRVRPLLNRFGVERLLRRVVPERIQDALPDSEGRVKRSAKGKLIDWEASTAVASGQGPLYVLAASAAERRQIREGIIEELDGLKSPDGTPVVERALPAEDVYSGPYTESGPDVLLKQAPHVHVSGAIGGERVFKEPETWAGENKDTGLFMAYGPDVDPTATIPELRITDLAPTLLALHDVSIPVDMDGTARTELFAEGTHSRAEEPRIADIDWVGVDAGESVGADEAVHSRLADLGYVE